MTARGPRPHRPGAATAAVLFVLLAPTADTCAAADGDTAPVIAQMDALWAERETGDVLPAIVALGSEHVGAAPDPYEIQWRLARALFWVAFAQPNRVTRKALAGNAADHAVRARELRPERVEGHYFYASAIGAYAESIGTMQAVVEGIAGKFEGAAERAYEIDPDFEHGAPGVMLGRYYFVLPWPKRDLGRSRRYLEQAAARHPRKLIARLYLAETYYALGERSKARAELQFVLDNDPAPGTEHDQPAAKPLARAHLQRWFSDASSGKATAASFANSLTCPPARPSECPAIPDAGSVLCAARPGVA